MSIQRIKRLEIRDKRIDIREIFNIYTYQKVVV